VRDVSKVLVDLGMFPVPEIPQDPCSTDDFLEVVDDIIEHVKEACDSNHGPWD
jgi:hypothetical protein